MNKRYLKWRDIMKNEVEILDVRDKEDFDEDHIPEAKSIPLKELEKRYSELNQESSIVVVCNRGGQKSQKALDFLRDKGYKNVDIMEGGMVAWKEKQSK
jgi:rhodanese-related sulfurtransferase